MTHPGGIHPYDAYVKVFASATDGVLCWWYLGSSFVQPAGLSEMPIAHSRTIMAFRIRHLSPDKMQIQWTEACLVTDAIHQQPITGFTNPMTRKHTPMKSVFPDGPVTYTISRVGGRAHLEMEQAGATIVGASIETAMHSGALAVTQFEDKVRPLGTKADGQPVMAALQNNLTVFANPAEIADPALDSVQGSGTYACRFEGPFPAFTDLEGSGPTFIRGLLIKARTDEIVDRTTWTILKAAMPDFFDGDRVAPDWAKVFREG